MIYFLVAIMALSVGTGNVLLKIGSGKPSLLPFSAFPPVNMFVISGGFFLVLGLVAYLALLQRVPLFVAQSLAVCQFVGVIALSYFFLGEQITARHLLGISVIALGIFIISSPG